MLSTPPAITRSCWPLITPMAARFTAVMPEPQNLSREKPPALMSKPASSAAMRAIQAPCLPTWVPQPAMTSSISDVSRWLRAASAFSTVDRMRWGWISARAPLPTLPTPRGVRAASMIQASVMISSPPPASVALIPAFDRRPFRCNRPPSPTAPQRFFLRDGDPHFGGEKD